MAAGSIFAVVSEIAALLDIKKPEAQQEEVAPL